jgi:hypothetical protein
MSSNVQGTLDFTIASLDHKLLGLLAAFRSHVADFRRLEGNSQLARRVPFPHLPVWNPAETDIR